MVNKEELLNTAKILLISDMKEDYDIISSFGFKKIDWFKSIVKADNYFMDNLDALDDYFIVITGFQKTYNYRIIKNVKLEDYLKSLKNRTYCYEMPNNRMTYPWYLELYVKIPNEIIKEKWNIDNKSLRNILSDIVNICTVGYNQKRNSIIKNKVNKKSIIVEKEDNSMLEIFENIRTMAISCLNNNSLYYNKSKDINIYEVQSRIRIEYMINGKIICAVVFDKDYNETKVIDMELLNEKGKLFKTDIILNPNGKVTDSKKINALKFVNNKLSDYINSLQIRDRIKTLKYSKIK